MTIITIDKKFVEDTLNLVYNRVSREEERQGNIDFEVKFNYVEYLQILDCLREFNKIAKVIKK